VENRSVIRLEVVAGDVLEYETDVLALKFAQDLYGVDRIVVGLLRPSIPDLNDRLPAVDQSLFVSSSGALRAPQVLFVGVQPLGLFAYAEIRQFGRAVMRELFKLRSSARYIALTLHGRGFGLDETEAFKAELAGLLDAFEAEEYPSSLEFVAIVERDSRTAARLEGVLDDVVPSHRVLPGRSRRSSAASESRAALQTVGDASAAKPNVFVAMPFAADFDDRFHYGIQNAANAAGYLCERADLASFTGDVITWVRDRIDRATLVVADLSTSNPNVYLEVGYAWGRGVPTVWLSPSASELRFDVRGQRCLVFNSIRHLEELLTKELRDLAR
jgi:hypothetical protein